MVLFNSLKWRIWICIPSPSLYVRKKINMKHEMLMAALLHLAHGAGARGNPLSLASTPLKKWRKKKNFYTHKVFPTQKKKIWEWILLPPPLFKLFKSLNLPHQMLMYMSYVQNFTRWLSLFYFLFSFSIFGYTFFGKLHKKS